MNSEELDAYEFKELTPEEIEANAKQYVKGWKEPNNCAQAYIGGYRSRDKEVEALNALCERSLDVIKRLRNCSNCWHCNYDCYSKYIIRRPTDQDRRENYKNWGEQIPCVNMDHWELGV